MIRAAKNGCASEITFKGRKVYHDWDSSKIPKSYLGEKLDKTVFLKENLINECHLPAIEELMIDWYLYENGWHVPYENGYKNEHLFYYLTQMHGYSGIRPRELEYFKE
tara:strand:+ start:4204 stop:4527 length:324 start_codon:yes stop_codon:yes gene_type:complete